MHVQINGVTRMQFSALHEQYVLATIVFYFSFLVRKSSTACSWTLQYRKDN